MVIKFLVTWVVVTWSLGACPPSAPMCDDYGRCYESMSTLAIACWDSSEKQMSKEFDTLAEAEAFVKEGEKDKLKDGEITVEDLSTLGGFGQHGLKGFKIEKVKREK